MYNRIAVIGRGYHYDECIKWLTNAVYYKQRTSDEYISKQLLTPPENLSFVINGITLETDIALIFNNIREVEVVKNMCIPYKCVWPNHVIRDYGNCVNVIGSNIYLPYSNNVDWYDFFKCVKVRGFN